MTTSGFGFCSLSCEYASLTLVNKENVWAYGRAKYSMVGIPSRDRGQKKSESERCYVAADMGFPSICCGYNWLINKLSYACDRVE